MPSTVQIGSLSARVTTLGELSDADIERWRRLDERATDPYPYASADYLAAAAEHWPGASSIRLLLVEQDDDLLLLMPFTVTRLHPRLPLRVTSTAEPLISDETARAYPLVDRTRGREALEAAFRSLRALGLPRLVDIAGLPADGELHAMVVASLSGRVHDRGRAALAVSRFPGRYPAQADDRIDVMAHHRSTSSKKQARQRLRVLERDLGGELRVRDRSQDPTVFEDFLELQSEGWKGDARRHGLAYRLTGRAEWFRRTAERMLRAGRLAAFDLHVDDRTVYIALGIRSGRTLFGWQDAYDETGAGSSLGTLGRSAFVNWVSARGHDVFDPNMSWSYVEAARIFPDRREQVRMLGAARGPVPAAVVRGFAAGSRFREAMKELASRVRHGAARVRSLTRRGEGRARGDAE